MSARMNYDIAQHGGGSGDYTGAFKAEISNIKKEIYDSGGATAIDYALPVAGGAVSGAYGGQMDVMAGAAKMVRETNDQSLDLVNDATVLATGHELYHGNLSQLGDESTKPDFNYRSYVDNVGANVATFGLVSQVEAGIDWWDGKINVDQFAERVGSVGLVQFFAGVAGVGKGGTAEPAAPTPEVPMPDAPGGQTPAGDGAAMRPATPTDSAPSAPGGQTQAGVNPDGSSGGRSTLPPDEVRMLDLQQIKATRAAAATSNEGIYEFPDQQAGGKPYVGQSGDIPQRLAQHEAAGRLSSGTETTTSVSGGKTAREIAEHERIQQLTGGQKASNSPAVSNQRDPIGPNRRADLDIPDPEE